MELSSRQSAARSCSSTTRSTTRLTLPITIKPFEQLDSAISKGDASTAVKLQSAIKFNSGGCGGEPPKSSLGSAIDTNFGSFEALIQKMNAEGAALQGSGWVWLGVDKELKRLVVQTTANQDPLVTKGASLVPLLGIHV